MRVRVRLIGAVECRRSAQGQALTLVGRDAEGALLLTLIGTPPLDLPAYLDDALVEPLDERRYRIYAQAGAWTLSASQCYLHRDLTGAIAQVLPPRAVRLRTRLMWRLVLAAAATRIGRWWLAR